MKKKRKHIKPLNLRNGLWRWFFLQTLIIVGVGVSATILVNRIAQSFEGFDFELWEILRITSIATTLIILLIIFEFLQYRLIKHHLERVCQAISRLSRGKYGQKEKIGRLTIFQDVLKDINTLSEELENVHMLRNDFVNSYSHEFKTPITSINGFAKLLLEDNTLTPETQQQYLQIIVEESDRLTALAGNTIILSQLEKQKIVTDKAPYSLDEQLRSCVILLSKSWEEKKLDVQGDIDEITFFGDEDMMVGVWLNLFYNAIKFTPEGGKITISAKKINDKINVSFADTGCGMSQETVNNIFKKYYQVDSTSTQKGLGLGLSIVKRSVELHGGRIFVKSEINKGTTFTVELPT